MDKVFNSIYDKPISIGRNDVCPCGSGKKFKNCCYNKSHEYAEYLAPNGLRAIIDSTEKRQNRVKINEYITDNRIIEYYQLGNTINPDLGIHHLKTIFKYFDNFIKPIHEVSSCKKGCSTCCSLIVSVSAIEAELIRDFIVKNYFRNEIKKLYAKIKENEKYYPRPLGIGQTYSEDITNKFLRLNIKCPFLDIDNTCMIYEVRPFVCRKYLVFTDSEICKTEDNVTYYRAGYFDNFIQIIDVISAITFKDIDYTKHISSWFLNDRFFDNKFARINLSK